MRERVLDYEVRLFKVDGALSVVMKIAAIGDAQAKMQIRSMLKDGITRAEIWRGLELVGIVALPPETEQ